MEENKNIATFTDGIRVHIAIGKTYHFVNPAGNIPLAACRMGWQCRIRSGRDAQITDRTRALGKGGIDNLSGADHVVIRHFRILSSLGSKDSDKSPGNWRVRAMAIFPYSSYLYNRSKL
jgi:hypothetical protein